MQATIAVAALLLCLVSESCCIGPDYRAKLSSYLKNNITDHSPLLYPRLDESKTVFVSLDAMLGHIVSVDTAKQSIKVSTYVQAMWPEERLVWNPADFGSLNSIDRDQTQVWHPLVMIYNGIGDNLLLEPQIPVLLTSIAPDLTSVTAVWRREFEFFCEFNMDRFPFDQHTCDLQLFFANRGYTRQPLPVRGELSQLNELAIYKKHSEWTLVNVSWFTDPRNYSIFRNREPSRLPIFIMRFEIKRVSTYYVMNVIAPLVLLTLLQVLVFIVPSESGEKLGFGITIMLSYTVFLLLLDGILPKTQAMPAIASFITAAMILSSISLLLTSLIMRFHFTPEGTRMPGCARAVFVRCLGRLFCVTGAKQVSHVPCDVSESSVSKADGAGDSARVSDWVVAARAVERLMAVFGLSAVAGIIGFFIVQPYA